MARLLRLLPIIIPIATRLLRNPKVRARLGLKPTDGSSSTR
ncbi:hypothetical protein [uncultured Amnibacterium sp.]